VTYANNLPAYPYLQQYLLIDQTIHWADPLGEMGSFQAFAGPMPLVAHLHGGENPSAYDGNPDSWFTPGAAGQRLTGKGFVTNVSQYPNSQQTTMLWTHDHCLGATRLTVYAGLVYLYLLRDQYDTGQPGTGLNLPAGAYEIEMAIQDRQFDTHGQLYFPSSFPGGLAGPPPDPAVHPFWIPMFLGDVMVVNGKSWPYLTVEPRRYRFRLLNGCNSRFLELSLANQNAQGSAPAIWQIGTDGGLLDAPVQLGNSANSLQLTLAPAERADIIVDFAPYAGQTLQLANSAPAPFPYGSPPDPTTAGRVLEFRVGTSVSGGADTSYDPAAPGATLRGGTGQPPQIVSLSATAPAQISQVRQITLIEVDTAAGTAQLLLNNTNWDGVTSSGRPVTGAVFRDPGDWVTELPQVGATERWEFINLTMDTHPIHLHLGQFQLLNRQACNATAYQAAWTAAFSQAGSSYVPDAGSPLAYDRPNADGAIGGNPAFSPYLQGSVIAPDANEVGWKDTFRANPGQVTRVMVRWAPQDVAVGGVQAGQNLYPFDPTEGPGYVWHCHILDHEDNEMMRPLVITV
jgi:FtsP/CotA-like multicopper oxidase with cupredoxin domain